MTVRPEVLWLILLCALVTILPRVLPFLAAHRMRLSPLAVSWFRFLPAAILSALLFPAVFLQGGELPKTLFPPEIIAAVAAAAIALATRNIIFTVIAGMSVYAVLTSAFA